MAKINIFALIYKSPSWADFVWNAVHENTEEVKNGTARFYFVVNAQEGVSEKLVEHLKAKNYPYFVFDTHLTQPKYPANIGVIYEAWNYGVEVSDKDCEFIVPINSDMYPLKGWLTELVKAWSPNRLVNCRLIESGKMPSGWWAVPGMPFGFNKTPESFRKDDCEKFVDVLLAQDGSHVLRYGGLFMPYLLSKKSFQEVGGYPLGNPNGVPGDQVFMAKLREKGIQHITAMGSICWHTQEGEVSTSDD